MYKYLIYNFYKTRCDEKIQYERFEEYVLFFENTEQRYEFCTYVEKNIEHFYQLFNKSQNVFDHLNISDEDRLKNEKISKTVYALHSMMWTIKMK